MNPSRKLGEEFISCRKIQGQYQDISMAPLLNTVNLLVLEERSVDAIIDRINRLGYEDGMSSLILIDKDSGIMKAFNEVEVNIKNIDLVLFKENKIQLKVCSVSEHNMEGLAEQKI